MDIETYVDNESRVIYGNSVPYMISAYGRLLRYNELTDKVETVQVSEIFVGLDCISTFINWFNKSGAIQIELPDVFKREKTDKHNYRRQFKNVLVAHNGFKFDYRFFIDKLSPMYDLNLCGDLGQIKKIEFMNILMLDFCLLMPMSLKRCAESLKTPLQKFPFDIHNITKTNWQSLVPQLSKYCLRDSEVLYQCFTKYIETRATTYYNQTNFPMQLFPQSLSSASLDIFRSCYLQYELESSPPHILCHEETQMIGGSTINYKIRFGLGIALDINSAHPSAMCNLMPYQALSIRQGPCFVRQNKFVHTDNYFCYF